MKARKVVVTGGAGFIDSSLAAALAKDIINSEITALDDLSSGCIY